MFLAAPALRRRMCVNNADTDCQGTAMYIFPDNLKLYKYS